MLGSLEWLCLVKLILLSLSLSLSCRPEYISPTLQPLLNVRLNVLVQPVTLFVCVGVFLCLRSPSLSPTLLVCVCVFVSAKRPGLWPSSTIDQFSLHLPSHSLLKACGLPDHATERECVCVFVMPEPCLTKPVNVSCLHIRAMRRLSFSYLIFQLIKLLAPD